MALEPFRWKGRFGPADLSLGETTFPPSTISALMAEAIEVDEGDVVIDVGTGTGILAIVAAKLGASRVFATDNSPDTEEVGPMNAAAMGVADRIEFHRGDLFDPLGPDVKGDVIIGDVSGIPDEFAAVSGWFPTGRGGGPRGSELPIRMLLDARRLLRPGGRLFLPTGSLQDEAAVLGVARSLYGKLKQLREKIIPLPGKLAAHATVRQLWEGGVVRLIPRGSRFLWEARVWELRRDATA